MPGKEHQVLDFATYTGRSAELSQLLNRFTVEQVNTLELKNVGDVGEELIQIFTNWLEKNPRIVSVLPKQTSSEIRSLIARNKFLKYNKCEVTEGDL